METLALEQLALSRHKLATLLVDVEKKEKAKRIIFPLLQQELFARAVGISQSWQKQQEKFQKQSNTSYCPYLMKRGLFAPKAE